MKKVFVTGFFDMINSGHIEFLERASAFGELYVGIGNDNTYKMLKGRIPVYSEVERKYFVNAIRHVEESFINRGIGVLDFINELKELKPDFLIVNEDGYSVEKELLCKNNSVKLLVLTKGCIGLPSCHPVTRCYPRKCKIPYSIDLINSLHDNDVIPPSGFSISISLQTNRDFEKIPLLCKSTREKAKHYWPHQLPLDHSESLAHLLFHLDNEPGNNKISCASNSIGICMPGITRHYYDESFWPIEIDSIVDDSILEWLEKYLFIISLDDTFSICQKSDACINQSNSFIFDLLIEELWQSILNQDFANLVKTLKNNLFLNHYSFNFTSNEFSVDNDNPDLTNVFICSHLTANIGAMALIISDRLIEGAIKVKIARLHY